MTLRPIILTGANLAAAVILPFILDKFLKLDGLHQWGVGVLIFIALTSWECGLILIELRQEKVAEKRHLDRHVELHNTLRDISDDFEKLNRALGTTVPLLGELIKERVEKLREDVHIATERKELYTDQNHMTATPRVLAIFTEGHTDQFMEVCRVESGKLFQLHDEKYFQEICKLAALGTIRQIRTLIVVDPENPAAKKKAGVLAGFCSQHQGYDFRIIPDSIYSQLFQDTHLEPCIDFGIYGDLFLFKTHSYQPINAGFFVFEKNLVSKFRKFFDGCWTFPAIIELPMDQREISMREVLDL